MYARLRDAERPRPFRVPGGNTIAWTMTVVCIVLLLLSITLLMYVPGTGVDWPVVIGAGLAILGGEAAIFWSERQKRQGKG